MNEQQAFRAVRNAIRLENLSRDVAAKIIPQLVDIFKQVKAEVRDFPGPDEALARQIRYKQLELKLADLFRPLGTDFYARLRAELIDEVEYQVRWAQAFLDVADVSPQTETLAGLVDEPEFAPQFTRTQLIALADEAEVLGQTLDRLFGEEKYSAAQIKKIDRVVKQGFLLGETNEEIASNLTAQINRAKNETRAIARTAVMDMSHRAHNRFWDNNSDRIVLWEFDATLDFRVCEQCYPHDGKRKEDRSKLPSVPVHPNCRCAVLPITRTQLALERQERKEETMISTVQIGRPNKDIKGKVRTYKTKVRFEGKKVNKFAQDVVVPAGQRPTMAFFLQRANRETRIAVLGKKNAGRFTDFLTKFDTPERALQEVIRNPDRKRR